MSTDPNPKALDSSQYSKYERAVVNSALWAAAGDILGWMTELVRGTADVRHRTGVTRVSKPVAWKRLIGGRNGPKVTLPAGTYSDDTQLRLAVSRSIRGNGSFDVETFAKIELTVWPSYGLGGGLGTKAAALNLSKRGVNWFSNFYDRGTSSYIKGGGNGAAMRVQPHVWATKGNPENFVLNVLRDALVTHGNPQGFCGALFHAYALADTLKYGDIPSIERWKKYINDFRDIPIIISKDYQLGAFWLPAWEEAAGMILEKALESEIKNALHDLDVVAKILDTAILPSYHEILESIGCLNPEFRGAGFKTSLAALALAHIYRDSSVADALIASANELSSDTDTIATMAGALLGAISETAPDWDIQDKNYIESEALRLAKIAEGQPQESFNYPDLGRWDPPANQTASVGLTDSGMAILGLGQLSVLSEEFAAGDSVWQWYALPFGQTILAKRRSEIKLNIASEQLPKVLNTSRSIVKPTAIDTKVTIAADTEKVQQKSYESNTHHSQTQDNLKLESYASIDILTSTIISSNFDDQTLGRILNRFIDSTQSIEQTIGFIAIIAKAKLARNKRRP